MAQGFESGVFAGNRSAWQGLGTVLPSESLDSREALQHSGLSGWNLTKQPVFSGNDEDGYRQIDGRWAVVRATDDKALGVVGLGYRIVQNEEAFDWMDYLLGGEGFHYESAGSLRGGSVVWLLAKAPFQVDLPDSPIDVYVLLINSHDGSYAVRAAITPVRFSCLNVLRSGLLKSTYRINHTANAPKKLAEAQKVLGLAKGAAERMAEVANELVSHKMTDADFAQFLNKLVPMPEKSGRGQTMALKTHDAIWGVYNDAPDQAEIRGTAWGAFNAVVAYHDHHMASRKTKVDPAENRMTRIMIGNSALPVKALELLS